MIKNRNLLGIVTVKVSPGAGGGGAFRKSMSHNGTFSLFSPWVVFLVRGVDQRILRLVLLDVLSQSLDGLGEWPTLHHCLVSHVFNLLAECFLVHCLRIEGVLSDDVKIWQAEWLFRKRLLLYRLLLLVTVLLLLE